MGERKFRTLGILVLLIALVECGPLERGQKPKEGLPREEDLGKDKIPRPGPQPGGPDSFGLDLGHPPPEILPLNPKYDDENNDIERNKPGKRFPPDFDRDEGPKYDDEDGEKSFDKEDDFPDKESDGGKIPLPPPSEGEEESIHKDVDESHDDEEEDEEPPKKDEEEDEEPPKKDEEEDEEEDEEPPEKDEEGDEEPPEKDEEGDEDKPVHEETDEPHGGDESDESENVPDKEDDFWGFKKKFGFGESALFDSPFFNLDQVRRYFGQLEKALGHVFRQTMDEARLLNGTYANTTEEEVEIHGKKYIVQKSVIKGADNHSTIYVETLSSRPKGTGDEKVIIEDLK